MQRLWVLEASSSAAVAWQCLISQIGFKFVNSKSLWRVWPCAMNTYSICVLVHVYVRIIPCMCTSALAKFAAELEPKSQKGLSPWNLSTLPLPVAPLIDPLHGLHYSPSYLAASVYPWAHARWLLSFSSMCCFWRLLYCIIQTYLYLCALWRHCSTLWWGFKYKTQICVTVCVRFCVGVCANLKCGRMSRPLSVPQSLPLSLSFPICGYCGVDILWLDFSDLL